MKVYHYNVVRTTKNEMNGIIKETVIDSIFCDIITTPEELPKIVEELKIKHNCSMIDVSVSENDNFKLK